MRRYGLFTSCLIFLFIVAWSSIAHAECPNVPNDPCTKLTVFAKSGVASKPLCIVQKDCSALGCDDCVFHIEWKVKLKSKDIEVCDESLQKLIPEGSYLKVELDYHIRKNGPCGSPVGTHLGDFKLFNAQNVQIGDGDMGGTNGLETHASLKECCKWPHSEGWMNGNINQVCRLRATYSSSLTPPTGVTDVCSKEYWRNWKLKIDGIILCSCQG